MDGSTHIDTALRGFVDRIITKHEDRDEVNSDIREIYGEVKDAGFVVAVVRALVKEARMDPEARHALYEQEQEYRGKLGLFASTPLGEATVRREAESGGKMDRAGMEKARVRWEAMTKGEPVVEHEPEAAPKYPAHRWAEKPQPFAEQPVHEPRPRGRPRKDAAASKPMFDA